MKQTATVDLKKIFPLGPDFLFIDEVILHEPGKKIIARKYLTGKEWFFKGHFPGNPVMPGSLITESMAQTGSLLFEKLGSKGKNKMFYVASCKMRFFNAVRPKDTLIITVYPVKILSEAGIFRAEAHVKNKQAAKGEFTVAIKT